jgi:hypothetical protein
MKQPRKSPPKAITNRIAPIGNRIIAQNQTAFIKGRYIIKSVVAAHEVIHATHSRKEKGLVFRIDYEKAYDRVSWEFIDSMLESRGFGSIFRGWGEKLPCRWFLLCEN